MKLTLIHEQGAYSNFRGLLPHFLLSPHTTVLSQDRFSSSIPSTSPPLQYLRPLQVGRSSQASELEQCSSSQAVEQGALAPQAELE